MTADQSSCENLLPKGKVPVEGSDIEVHNTICAICNL